MKRSIATVCLSGDLRQKIDAVSHANYDGIEIFENDLLLFEESPAVVRQMTEDAGLDIVALQPFRDFECMPVEKMKKNFDRAERKFDLMEELGTDTLLLCSNVSPLAVNSRERAVADLYELAERAKKRGFKLGYEALAWGRYVKDFQDAWEIVRTADHSNLGIILDSFHIFSRGKDLSLINEIPGDKIALVQVADAPWLDMDVMQWSRHFRCFPGQGDFPMLEFMEAILRTGYEGYLSHEIFNDEFRSSPCKATAIDGMRSLLWLEQEVSRAEPDLVVGLPNQEGVLLPEASLDKVEFIEFAVDPESSDELVTYLSRLGFVKTHHHKSKDVSLYRQGDISIVLNEEPDSFAQSFYLVHGISVCAIAYSTPDAKGMAERAAFFGYPKFGSNVDAGEMEIPAIRGIGGKLIYFVQENQSGDRFFDIDFVEEKEIKPVMPDLATSSLLEVDHIVEGISVSEFLSTSLFFRILFGLEIAQPQDLIDPYGIVVSRTATSKNKKIRIPFNMSRSWGSSTARFMDVHKGSGVQHIAFTCDDIFSAAERVGQDLMLPIPENYYDDLEARFTLEDELSEKLRKYNLLYDQNESGTLIHFYTREINGIFFEVLQRNKYGNYGETNAHVRMAAQARLRKSQ